METATGQRTIALAVLLFAGLVFLQTASARAPAWTPPSKPPAPEPAPLPTEGLPAILPDAAPSLSLGPFLKTHLDKILAPLGTPAFAQADLLADMKARYVDGATAAPDARKPAYQLAAAVCDTLGEAVAQRRKAVAALDGSYNVRSSEAIQPRGGAQAVHDSDRDEWFFYNGQKNNWLQNASNLRQQVAALSQRERAAEAQAGSWQLPPSPLSVSVPAPVEDPVVGRWLWDGRLPLTLESDHVVTGAWRGTWQYTCTTDIGRNYELHWAHKNWVDYVVLAADGKMLDGKSKQGKHVTANR